jgi:nucleoside-specific outer membrane channel protein Tsx
MIDTKETTVSAIVGATPTSRLTTSRDVGIAPITLLLLCTFLFIWPLSAAAKIFDWHSTEIQYLHGNGYQIPGNPNDVSRSILTLTHADGWALGRNFFFMDTLISDSGEPSQVNLYGELYSYLSLSKMSGENLAFGPFKDLNLAGGVNLGENLNSSRSGARIILYGFNIEFNLPGFKFFSVDFLRHDVLEPVSSGTSWQLTPVWKLPFTVAGTHWSLEGFADFIGAKNANYVGQILAQPQLRLDVGDFWGMQEHIYIGIEYQYWHNKYGIKDFDESLPQALLLWKF